MSSAFMGEERIAPDEERLVLLKPVVQFYLTYGGSRVFLYIYLHAIIILSDRILGQFYQCHFKSFKCALHDGNLQEKFR